MARPSSRRQIWDNHFWRAGFIFMFLSMTGGVAYVVVLHMEADNPRRSLLAAVWPTVSIGSLISDVLEVMGPPDSESEAFERVPACESTPDPCAVATPCETHHICVHEYTWYTWPEDQLGNAYTVCTDESNTVRKKTRGVAFRLITP